MSASKWIEDIKRQPLTAVLRAIGMSERGRTWGPCPACGATQRGSEDGRGPIGISAAGGWKCHAGGCSGKGDGVTALCWHLTRSESPSDDGWKQVRDYATEQGWCQKGGAVTDRVRHASGASRAPGAPTPAPQEPDPEEREDYSRGMFGWSPDLIDRCAAALAHIDENRKYWSDAELDLCVAVDRYLYQYRNLTEQVVNAAKLGIYVDADHKPILDGGRPWLVIPLYDKAGRPVSAHFRRVPIAGTCADCDAVGEWKECETCRKKKRYRLCPKRPTPLYGANLLNGDPKKPVYIVEGELDVLALHVYGVTENVVSGTAGADTFKSKQDWLDAIEPYETFYLCYDDDGAGDRGAAELATALGPDRCSRVKFPMKDVGDCLIAGVSGEQIRRAFVTADPLVDVKFRKAESFMDLVKQVIAAPGAGRGVSTGSDLLDTAIGGWRPGVVVVTGDTGAGKTTWLTWVMWNLATRGYPVAITSFEQTPRGSVEKVLRMQLGDDYTKVTEQELDRAGRELTDLPLYFVDHYGHLPFAKLSESLKYAARRLGVKHVLVDHLGFLLNEDADDERRAIEAVVRSLVLVAKHLGITVFLVVHPRNDPDAQKPYQRVTMKHLKGASAIRQDADDVLVVTQEPPNTEYGRLLKKGKRRQWPQMRLFVDKKRSEFGNAPQGGHVVMPFDPVSLRYADAWGDTPMGRRGGLLDTTPPTMQGEDSEPPSKGGRTRKATGRRRTAEDDPDDMPAFDVNV